MYFLCKAHISRQVYMKDSERSAGRILRGRLGTVVVTLSVLLTFALAASAQVQSGYIVMFRPGTTRAARADFARRAGAVMRFNYSIVDAIAVRALNANARALLQQDRSVIAIVPDFRIHGVAPRLPGLPAPPRNPPRQDPSATQTIPAGVNRVGVPG